MMMACTDIGRAPFLPDPEKRPRLALVAMSGGVDSAFAAWALKGSGVEVVGVHFKMGDFGPAEGGVPRCCSLEDARDARKTADRIGIPLYVVSMVEDFHQEVIAPFVQGYARGLTPNPCILCNPRIKWRALVQKAREIGADAIATGHHCRVVQDAQGPRLLRGVYTKKDQSYFLAFLSREQLAMAVLPAGWFDKSAIRQELKRADIPIAMKPESQDVCFSGPAGYAAVIEQNLAGSIPGPGEIVDLEGRVLGRHPGVHHFTVGQRKGINVAAPQPLYVLAIDAAKARIVVGPWEECFSTEAAAKELHWLRDPPLPDETVQVKIRYKADPAPARVEMEGPDRMRIIFETPQRSITPGQAAVVYRGDEVLGGGIFQPEALQ